MEIQTQALEIDPKIKKYSLKKVSLSQNLAHILKSQGKYFEAPQQFDKALRTDPKFITQQGNVSNVSHLIHLKYLIWNYIENPYNVLICK